MKTKNLFGILVLFLVAINFVGCNDDDNRWYDSMKDGGLFHAGTHLRFFYVDEDGNDLIDLENLNTLPVSSREILDSQPVIEAYDYGNYYNGELNHVIYNENKELNEFFTFALGDSRHSNYTFYVYHNGVADKMEVTFQYEDKKVDGGLFYLSRNLFWRVNGVEVYNVNKPNSLIREYVYLVKKKDGTTEVVVDK